MNFDEGFDPVEWIIKKLGKIATYILRTPRNPDTSRNDPRVQEIINELPLRGSKMAGEIIDELEWLKNSYLEDGVDLNRTARSIQSDVTWVRRKKYRSVEDFYPKMDALRYRTHRLESDYIALIHCLGIEEVISESYNAVDEVTQQIGDVVNSDKPLSEIFNEFISHARNAQRRFDSIISSL